MDVNDAYSVFPAFQFLCLIFALAGWAGGYICGIGRGYKEADEMTTRLKKVGALEDAMEGGWWP